jgi:stage V sporulation protein SpoVS
MQSTEKTHSGFLKVKGRFDIPEDQKKYIKRLASATFMCLSNYGYCEMRCVGKDAVYNAVKAMIVANGYCAQRGAEIMFSPSFDEGNIGVLKENQVENVTAIKFSVKDYNTSKLNELKSEDPEK